jgi:hypothetical protein
MVLRLAPRTTLLPPHLKISPHFSIWERRLSTADNHNRKDGRSLLNAIKRFSDGCRLTCRFCRFCAPFPTPLRFRRLEFRPAWARHIKIGLSRTVQAPRLCFQTATSFSGNSDLTI